jgi:DNA-binding response OmpR family regulator
MRAVGSDGGRSSGEDRVEGGDGTVAVKVLVVEDDDDLAYLLTRRLRDADFEVERASNGEAGVELVRDFGPEFVFMDWMMPIKSGIEASGEIRADPAIRQPYIAMMSARTGPDDLVRARQAGVDEYITKPVSAREIVERLAELITARERLALQLLS